MAQKNNPMAKLREVDIHEIFTLHVSGVSREEIARRKGISYQHIGRILRGERWGSIGKQHQQGAQPQDEKRMKP